MNEKIQKVARRCKENPCVKKSNRFTKLTGAVRFTSRPISPRKGAMLDKEVQCSVPVAVGHLPEERQ
jgi:hypothetical protein